MILRASFLLLSFLFCLPASATDDPQALMGRIAVGRKFTCALTEEGPRCWNKENQFRLPRGLRNVRQVGVNEDTAYFLDDEGFKIWPIGADSFHLRRDFKKPSQLSVYDGNGCVVTAEGIRCWGEKIGTLPTFVRPWQVAVGPAHACALDAEGVKCWGEVNATLPVGTKFPVYEGGVETSYFTVDEHSFGQVAVGQWGSCVLLTHGSVYCLKDGEWQSTMNGADQISVGDSLCWVHHEASYTSGGCQNESENYVSKGVPAIMVTPPQGGACFVGAGTKCFGDQIPELASPYIGDMSLSESQFCFIVNNQVKCEAQNGAAPYEIPAEISSSRASRQVWTAKKYGCVAQDKKFKCWGELPAWAKETLPSDEEFGFSENPTFHNESVAIGDEFLCVFKLKKCWGAPKLVAAITDYFKKSNTSIYSAGASGDTVCGLTFGYVWDGTESFVLCWNTEGKKVFEQDVSRYRYQIEKILMQDTQQVCLQSRQRIDCLKFSGSEGFFSLRTPPGEIWDAALHKDSICVQNQGGLHCEGLSQPAVPENFRLEVPGTKDFTRLAPTLRTMSRSASLLRKEFYLNLAAYLDETPSRQATETIYALLKPAIESADAKILRETFLPLYQEAAPAMEKRRVFDEAAAARKRTLATLKVVQFAVAGSLNFYGGEAGTRMNALLPPLGRAYANPTAEKVAEVVRRLDEESSLLETLRQPKASFLADTILLAKEMLR